MMSDDWSLERIEEYQARVWNAAIEAVIQKLKEDFVAPEVVIKIIREVKK